MNVIISVMINLLISAIKRKKRMHTCFLECQGGAGAGHQHGAVVETWGGHTARRPVRDTPVHRRNKSTG